MSNCTLYLVNDKLTMVMCVFGVLVTITTFLSNLTMALYFSQLKRRPGGMVYYKAIIYLSITASFVGQPLETANALFKTTNLVLNLASNFCLFLLFCATYHCIAGLTFERYIAIKREGHKKKMEINLLAGGIIILVISMCTPKFYNLYQIILARDKCTQPPPSWLTIGLMCLWLSYCSFSINFLTKKAIDFVESYDKIRQKRLGKTQKTNIRRLKVTKRMWLVFSMIWLPYGLVNILQTTINATIYEHLNAISRGITFTSFTVMPLVYYFMDKNYAEYINQRVDRMKLYLPFGKHTPRIDDLRRSRANTMSTAIPTKVINVSMASTSQGQS